MIKKDGDKWLCDIQPGGRGFRRYRKTFKTKAEALAFERKKLSEFPLVTENKPIKDTQTLNELIELWYKNTGQFLSSGKDTKERLLNASKSMGSPRSSALTATIFINYRVNRITQGISPSTLNRELQTFKAMFNDLIRSGDIKQNPFASVRLIRVHQPKMQFLTIEQINQLLTDLKKSSSDAYLIALVCLSTGSRWGEAQNLTFSDLSPYRVHYHHTKSKKSRSVPIPELIYQQLHDRLKDGPMNDAYSTFSRHLEKLAFNLPSGERTHVLRHTFASHFIMNGGNILTLQKILGHASLDMTLRYAHLAPDYLQEVLEKNPLVNL